MILFMYSFSSVFPCLRKRVKTFTAAILFLCSKQNHPPYRPPPVLADLKFSLFTGGHLVKTKYNIITYDWAIQLLEINKNLDPIK